MTDSDKFRAAVETAALREKGLHGSVGTQNEKLIHAALKNYYAEFSDEQEIRIGEFYADAVNENGIIEIQTRQLYKLREKLKTFLGYTRVTVVHPVPCGMETLYINEDTGEVAKHSPMRNMNSLIGAFDELYSIRGFLNDENLRIILARIKVQRQVFFTGDAPPDLSDRRARKKCRIEKIPLSLCGEMIFECKADYAKLLPEGLPEKFTKKELALAAHESASSLRTEVLRETGIIKVIGKRGGAFLYKRDIEW